MRVADCGYYEARRDGNTCRIVECLNKIIAVRCSSQILSLPLSSGTNKSSQNPLPVPKPALLLDGINSGSYSVGLAYIHKTSGY